MFRLRTKARAAPRVSALISFAEANGPSVLLLYTSLRIRTETSVVNCSVAIAVTQHEILRGNARRHAPRRTDPARQASAKPRTAIDSPGKFAERKLLPCYTSRRIRESRPAPPWRGQRPV